MGDQGASRRALIAGVLAVLLPGCGFHPVYGNSGATTAAQDELAAIAVGLIPERNGQLLRLALQDRLERAGAGRSPRYDLTVSLGISSDQLAIQTGNTASRIRFVGVAQWSLTAQDAQRRTLKTGSARQLDGQNIFNNQYFASDMESEAVQRRITAALADQITLQLAAYFAQQARKG